MNEVSNQKLTFEQVKNLLLLTDIRTIKSYVKNGHIPKIAIDEENFTIDAVLLAKEMGVENFDEPFISSQEAHEILELPLGRINESYCKNKGLNYYRLKNSLKTELLFRKSEIESYLSVELKHFPLQYEKAMRLKYFLELGNYLERIIDILSLSDKQRKVFLGYLNGENIKNLSVIHSLNQREIRQIINKAFSKSVLKLNSTESWMRALRDANFLLKEPDKLVKHLNDLQNAKNENEILKKRLEVYESRQNYSETENSMYRLLNTPIEELDLSVRLYNILNLYEYRYKINMKTLDDTRKVNCLDFLKLPNAGKKSLIELEELLQSKGLSFAE